jgi:abequosyltransferase
MDRPLLTIAIPTYNRVEYLKRNLDSIFSQIDSLTNEIEIIISDNASTDRTEEFLITLQSEGKQFKYYRNQENLGPDKNISSCYTYATGTFLWIFSDDDFLVQNSLAKILKVLKDNLNAGNCFLSSRWYSDDAEPIVLPDGRLNYSLNTPRQQFKRLSYWITFISGNIVNKKKLEESSLVTFPYNTSLVQLGWIVPSIFLGDKNIYVEDEVLCCKIQKNRGYPIVQIFCTNLFRLLRSFEKKGIGGDLVKMVRQPLMQMFFLSEIKVMTKQKEKVVLPMLKEYYMSRMFWRFFLPRYLKELLKKHSNRQ